MNSVSAPPDCSRCPRLVGSRRCVVNGVGPLPARVLIVAQNPGRQEERVGYPLAEQGWSGSRVRSILLPSANLREDEVRFENIVRCRPPRGPGGDKPPTQEEIRNCGPFLHALLDQCRPEFVVTLGALALKWFLPSDKLESVHGRPILFHISIQTPASVHITDTPNLDLPSYWDTFVVPMYHPASAHPARNPRLAEVLVADWKRLGQLITSKAPAPVVSYRTVTEAEMSAIMEVYGEK